MAKEKKSFVLYSDQKELIEALTDEQAGKLIKHILKYVNDENPTLEDPLLKIAFMPIKQQLKRDLEKWEKQREQRSLAGKKSAESRQRALTSVNENVRKATVNVNDNVNDNVNVNVNVNDNVKNIFSFRSALMSMFVDSKLVDEWLRVRKAKKAVNTETAFNAFKKQVELSKLSAQECVKIAIENSWSGFKADWVNNQKPTAQVKKAPHAIGRKDFFADLNDD